MECQVAFEWRVRLVDFTNKDDAETYLEIMKFRYNVCLSESETYIYDNGNSLTPYTLRITFTTKNAKVSGGW